MQLTRRDLLMGVTAAGHWSAAKNTAWLKDTFRELHLDAHFSQVPDPYKEFDAEASAQILKDAEFQMISYFAVCGAGYSYYPTKIGIAHPGLKRDFTGEMSAALKKRGIRTLAYVSAGPDRRSYSDHPDWMITRNPDTPPESRNGMAMICLNSPWLDDVHIPQLKEIVSLYDVDGFFIDNLISKFINGVCYCKYCRQAFGEIPISDNGPKVAAYHKWLSGNASRYAEKVVGALTKTKPSLTFTFTHLWVTRNPVKPPAAVKQIVWEPVPPYPGTLSVDFSLEARYLSTLPGIENWSCMATRGNGWGDYALRDPAAFRHEAAVLLAAGGRPYLADDSYPSGNPDHAVYQVYREINQRTKELEPFIKNCVPVKDTAVLLSADSMWSTLPLIPPREWINTPSSPSVAGAHKVLVEEHVQFGILNSEVLVETLDDYKALIIPEQRILSDKECDAIRRFVKEGGALIVTGDTGNLALAEVLGIERVATEPRPSGSGATRAYLRTPQMDVQVRGAYCKIKATTARTLLDLVPPASKQAPAEKAEGPGVTLNQFGKGRAIYCSVPLFDAYYHDDTPALRNLASWMLQLVHPGDARTINVENAPLKVEVSYNYRGKDKFVHLVNYSADRRMGGAPRVQDFSAVHGIQVRCRSAAKPKQVSLVPERKPITFDWKAGWTQFQAESLLIHSAYMMEG